MMEHTLLFGIAAYIFGFACGWWVKKILVMRVLDAWLKQLKRIED